MQMKTNVESRSAESFDAIFATQVLSVFRKIKPSSVNKAERPAVAVVTSFHPNVAVSFITAAGYLARSPSYPSIRKNF